MLRSQLALGNGLLSLPLFAFAFGAWIAMMAAGWFVDRWGSGRATRLAAGVFVLALPWPPLAPSLPALVVAALLAGLGNGCMEVSMNATASALEQRAPRPIMSSFHAAFSLGGLAGAAIAAELIGAGAGRWAMPCAAGLGAMLLAVAWAALGAPDASMRGDAGTKLALPGRAALPLCVASMVCMLCEGAVGDWSAVYLATAGGAARAASVCGYIAFSAAMVAGRLGGDVVVGRLGRPRVVVSGGVLACAGLSLAVALPSIVPASFGFLLVGLGLSNVVPSLFSLGGLLGRGSAGIAVVATAGYLGFLGGPPAIGGLSTLAGLRVAIGCLAAAALLLPGAMALRRTPPGS